MILPFTFLCRVVDPSYLGDQRNLRPTFASIRFDYFLDINEKIFPVFVLQLYQSVHLIRSLNGTLSIAFIIQNFEITLRLEEFSSILRVRCKGVCVYTPEWPISPLPNGVDPNSDIYPPLYKETLLIHKGILYQRPPASPETRTILMPVFATCSTISQLESLYLAYYIAKRMVSVTKSADMIIPYGMLLTRLFEHVRVAHPYAFSDDLYLVDHVMIPLSEKYL
ncbi:hypothetical protein Tco_1544032 [Tanacetum coccineum]